MKTHVVLQHYDNLRVSVVQAEQIFTIDKSRALGLPATGLLVDVGNPKAEALYNKVGFQYAGTISWGGHGMRHYVLHN